MKTILYTGATSGIAKNVIKKIKNKYIIYVGVHTRKQQELLTKKYKKEKNIKIIKLDLLNKKDIKQIQQLDIDILISNAAINLGGSLLEVDIKKLKQVYEINVFKNLEIIQIVLKNMIKKNSGKIIIMSSLSGIMPIKFTGSYSSTKACLINIAQILKKELKELNSNIKIKLIEPGMYKTGFNQLMINDKYDWMEEKSYFKEELEKIKKKEKLLYRIIEYKNTKTIVRKIISSIKHDNKFIYSAPIEQRILTKIYSIFNS